jgi:uncharacterized protein YeeX (DUF496 family)
MKLYEITDKYESAINELSKIEGLDQETINDTLESIEGEIVEKGKNVAAYFQNLDSSIREMKEAEKRIADRRKAMEKQSEGLKDYLRFNMEKSGVTKIECAEFKVTLGKPSKIVEVDIDQIDDGFIGRVVTEKVDKALVKKYLTSGEEVKGARLVDGKSRLIIK